MLKGQHIESTDVPNEFLMNSFTIFEELESSDLTKERLLEIKKENDANIQQIEKEIDEAFLVNDFDKARELTAKLNYLVRIDEYIQSSKLM